MRHLKAGRKFNRTGAHRRAMFRNMVTSLMEHGRIQTTEARAKELRRIADRLITLGRRVPPSALEGLEGDDLARARARRVHYIRRARLWVRDRDVLHRIFNEYAERYKDRPGGYTRIVKTGFRKGDNARMAVIELVREEYRAGDGDEAADAPQQAAAEEAAAEEAAAEDGGGEGGEE